MVDIELVIKIDENTYHRFINGFANEDDAVLIEDLFKNGTPLKSGKWIAIESEEMKIIGYYCSECDLPMETEEQTRFCPNCGARMENYEGKWVTDTSTPISDKK